MSIKQDVINAVIAVEGDKFTNDPADSGGPTKYGITERTARRYGYKGRMEDLPRETAFAIYEAMYWAPLQLDAIEKLSPTIAAELADTGVNCGPTTAATFLQRALNALNNRGERYRDIKIDGLMGKGTVAALGEYLKWRGKDGEVVMLRTLNSLQGARYVQLVEAREKDERFIFGWMLHRVN